MPRDGSVTLSDFRERGIDRVMVACTRCERAGTYRLEHAMQQWGDAKLTELLGEMTGYCPHRKKGRSYDRCGAYYPALMSGL